ncbi:MAG: AraC family transcriptional regulator [Acetatifactor sp.]|nr:AraC family transcriptional regulator [Acetatifactor sp.]
MEDCRCAAGPVMEDLNPTFLFTWTGTRKSGKDEDYHSHDILEMAFVLSGTGRYRVDGKTFSIQEGDLLIFNPGVRHQALYCPEVEIPATEFFVGFSDIQFQGIPANTMPLPNGAILLHTTGELRRKLYRICTAMQEEKAVSRQGRYFMMKAYLMQLILLVIREQCEPVEKSKGCSFESVNKKYLVEQIINYFEDHYSEKISLDQIAENMYLSPFYISKIFKSETGETPIRHLIDIRLENAMELLEGGWQGSIQEVAARVGYDDAYHFSKLFKKRYGISPSQARKKA